MDERRRKNGRKDIKKKQLSMQSPGHLKLFFVGLEHPPTPTRNVTEFSIAWPMAQWMDPGVCTSGMLTENDCPLICCLPRKSVVCRII